MKKVIVVFIVAFLFVFGLAGKQRLEAQNCCGSVKPAAKPRAVDPMIIPLRAVCASRHLRFKIFCTRWFEDMAEEYQADAWPESLTFAEMAARPDAQHPKSFGVYAVDAPTQVTAATKLLQLLNGPPNLVKVYKPEIERKPAVCKPDIDF